MALPHDNASEVLFGDLAGVIAVMRRRRMTIITLALLGMLAGGAYALLAKPIYRAAAVVAPTTATDGGGGLARLAGQFSGLAALAGISGMSGNEAERAFAVLTSSELIEAYMAEKRLLPKLFPDRWDDERSQWLESEGGKPTRWEAIQLFDEDIRRVTRDTRTGMITVVIEWNDPMEAAEWANSYVAAANRVLRERAITEANASLKYLHDQLESTGVMEIKDVLYQLIEAEMGKLTIAETKPGFAFDVVDAAVAPDLKSYVRPRRFAAVVIGLVGGFLLGLLYAVIHEAVERSSSLRVRATMRAVDASTA